MPSRTINDVLTRLTRPIDHRLQRLPAPAYGGKGGVNIGLAVESMRRHMTNEGWEIFEGLEEAGYRLCGYGLLDGRTDALKIVTESGNVGTVVLQDKREWDTRPRDFRDPRARFTNVEELAKRPDIFKVTILKDAHQNPPYHRQSAAEIGCHAWIVYYHPRIVSYLAPWLRPEHLVRTYHSVNLAHVPPFNPTFTRRGCLLSGALSAVYPLRLTLVRGLRYLSDTTYLPHPGYHRNGCATPDFLQKLNGYRVAICTSSIYGYALRKIIEATACGCIVLTDLPEDEVLPRIDGNVVRITSDFNAKRVGGILRELYAGYSEERQRYYAEEAGRYYSHIAVGGRLANDIEILRRGYNDPSPKAAGGHSA